MTRTTASRVLAAALSVAAFALAPAARALSIVEWDLAAATGQTADVLLAAADVSATAIQASAGVTPWASTAQDGFIAASGWATGLTPDPARYYEWSVSADPGFAIDYQSLTLALFRGIQGADHGAQRWDLRASTDGFATSDLYLQTLDLSASPADTQTLFAGADISALGTVAGTVSFRLYGYDYTSTADFSGLGNDSGWLIYGTGANPRIDGNVVLATPEPGTALLIGGGLLLLGLRRRSS